MRRIRLAILPLLVATSLAAQAPPASTGEQPAAVLAPRRSAFFDVAALVESRERFGLEPLALGRWTVGLVGSHSHSSTPPPILVAPVGGGGGTPVPTVLCPITGCPTTYPGSGSSDNAWSLDLAVRYYPAALSLAAPQHRLMVYLGEFIGYQRRTLTQVEYPPMPLAETAIPCAATECFPFAPPVTERRTFEGWEPGAELGARLIPLAPVFVDVGGWFRLVTVDDPTQRIRPGEVDARLVVAVGVGW
jgi:hypothetical protein